MALGIRPTNDFAFQKIFGSPENKQALISLLNAILDLKSPIVDVTLANPFNLQDFQDDKLSVLDVKAVDQSGAIYDIEMQVVIREGVIQRIVFYGCELYVGQLKAGDAYTQINPVYSICIVDGLLWKDSAKVHHAFRLMDEESKRILDRTIEIHTIELGKYNKTESELKTASLLECWLYWFLHAHEYELDELLKLFPQEAIRLATQTIARIAQITEDKAMYDAREKAVRDRQWEITSAFREGEIKGKIEGEIKGKIEGKIEGEVKLIRTLQGLLLMPLIAEAELRAMSLEQLELLASSLQGQLRGRTAS